MSTFDFLNINQKKAIVRKLTSAKGTALTLAAKVAAMPVGLQALFSLYTEFIDEEVFE